MPWVVAILMVLALCGCGGVAVTYAAQWVGSKVVAAIECQPSWKCKETEPSVARLAQPVTRQAGYLTVTVSKVEVTERAVLVTITARNGGPQELSMPLLPAHHPRRPNAAARYARGRLVRGHRPGQGRKRRACSSSTA